MRPDHINRGDPGGTGPRRTATSHTNESLITPKLLALKWFRKSYRAGIFTKFQGLEWLMLWFAPAQAFACQIRAANVQSKGWLKKISRFGVKDPATSSYVMGSDTRWMRFPPYWRQNIRLRVSLCSSVDDPYSKGLAPAA